MTSRRGNDGRADGQAAGGAEQLPLDFTRPAAPPAAPPLPPRPALPRDAAERGYHTFAAEQAAALQQLERRCGLILNHRVRVTLAGLPAEFTGRLRLAQLLPVAGPDERLRQRIGTVEFDAADIESCVRLDG